MGNVFSPRQPVTVSPQTHRFHATTQAGTLVYVALSNKTHKVAPLTESCRIDNTLFFGLKIRFEDIHFEAQIDTGNFGVVYKAIYKGKHLAVKRLLIPNYSKKSIQDFQNELSILSVLTYPNIVQFLGAVTEPPTFCILTELCAGSLVDLLRLAQSKRLNITWGLTLGIALDCAKACSYLHTLNPVVLHRDIKGENHADHRDLSVQTERLWALAKPRPQCERTHHVRHPAVARTRSVSRRRLLGKDRCLLLRHRALVRSNDSQNHTEVPQLTFVPHCLHVQGALLLREAVLGPGSDQLGVHGGPRGAPPRVARPHPRDPDAAHVRVLGRGSGQAVVVQHHHLSDRGGAERLAAQPGDRRVQVLRRGARDAQEADQDTRQALQAHIGIALTAWRRQQEHGRIMGIFWCLAIV
ncbi:Tkl protein kinase, partial [Globisporangium splendens]